METKTDKRELLKEEIRLWKIALLKPVNSGHVRQRTIRGFIRQYKEDLKELDQPQKAS